MSKFCNTADSIVPAILRISGLQSCVALINRSSIAAICCVLLISISIISVDFLKLRRYIYLATRKAMNLDDRGRRGEIDSGLCAVGSSPA